MKLVGNIEVCNRTLPALNLRNQRSRKSSLSLGKLSGNNEIFLLLQTNQDKSGSKYKVTKNLMNVFTKFVDEGKATIRFKEPPHDLCIRCDPVMLKSFLKVLRLSLENKDAIKTSVLPASSSKLKAVKEPPTKLQIKDKSQYPTLQGFPRTLVSLEIVGINWSRFDSRILQLKNLKELNLSNNKLTILPREVGLLELHTLNVADNNLGAAPHKCLWMLEDGCMKSLRLLNLSRNNLSKLPDDIVRFQKLVTLNVEGNKLTHLPSGIGRLKTLKYLNVSQNKLKSLPFSITFLDLNLFDISSNNFSLRVNTLKQEPVFPTLLELAAIKTLNSNFAYSPRDVPVTVVQFLNQANYCVCGSACFQTYELSQVNYDLKKISFEMYSNFNTLNASKLDVFLCSKQCVNKI